MNTRGAFWKHVNEALDERRDPLEDANVQRLVGEEPELLDELRRLDRGLGLAIRVRPTRPIFIAVAAALLVVSFGTWLVARESSGTVVPYGVDDSSGRVALRDVPACRVLYSRVSVSHVDERGTETITSDGLERSRTFVARDGSVVKNFIHLARAETLENRP